MGKKKIQNKLTELKDAHDKRKAAAEKGQRQEYHEADWHYAEVSDWFFKNNLKVMWRDDIPYIPMEQDR